MMATETPKNVATASLKCKCPLCGTLVKEAELGRAGVTNAELEIVRRHVRGGTFGKLLQLLDIVFGKIDPERMNKELLTKNAISEVLRAVGGQELSAKKGVEEILKVLNEIRLKVAGPAIGKVGEAITLKEFKAATPGDEFSEDKADKRGTDIIATVKENKKVQGKIAISVKYDSQWKSEFIRQLEDNMKHEGTDFGILATTSMPKEALSDKIIVTETANDGILLVVNQEYASVAYQGLRLAVIAWEHARKKINDAQQRIDEKAKVFKAVADWVNGRKLKETLDYLSACRRLSEETDEVAMQLRDHTVRKVKGLLEMQQNMRNNLGYATDAISELKNLLSGEGRGRSDPSTPNVGESCVD